MQNTRHTDLQTQCDSPWRGIIQNQEGAQQPIQQLRVPTTVVNYQMSGQDVKIHSRLLAPIQSSIRQSNLRFGLRQVEDHQPIIRAFLDKALISQEDVRELIDAVKSESPNLLQQLKAVMEKGILAINEKLTANIQRALPEKHVFKSENALVDLDLFNFGVSVSDDSEPQLIVENADFFQHVDTSLTELDSNDTQKIYYKILDTLTAYSGIWQTDLTEYHWRETWTPINPDEIACVKDFLNELSTTNIIEMIEKYEQSKASQFVYTLSEAIEMCGYEPDTDDFYEWYAETADNEYEVGLNRYEYRKLTNEAKTIEQFNASISLNTELDTTLHHILTFIYAELIRDENTLKSFIPEEEEAQHLGFVLQEKANDHRLQDASQEAYEHYLNAGEGHESYAINLESEQWLEDIISFGTAMALITTSVALVADSLLD